MSAEALVGVALGIGLAAATGFRVFLPLLIAALAARWGAIPLSDGFMWVASTGAIITLSTASLVEAIAYFVPGVDHALDVIATPATFLAGTLASASVMVDLSPAILWPVAIIAGGGIAGLTKGTAALVRAKSAVATGGLSNPVVSTAETVGATGLALFAIALPVACAVAVVLLLFWIGRRLRQFMVRRAH